MALRRAAAPRGGSGPAARIPVTLWVDRVRAASGLVRQGHDPEAVHQLRVALGHVEVWLRMARRSALQARVRALRRAASPVRDLDVRLALSPPKVEARRIKRRRIKAWRTLIVALDEARALVETLAGLPALPLEQVHTWARRSAARVRSAGKRWRPRDGIAATHTFRRRVRRLRYALEFGQRSSEAVATLQGTLGTVCDCALTLSDLGGGHPRFRRRLERRQREAAQLARAQWKALRGSLKRLAQGPSGQRASTARGDADHR